MRTHGCGVYNGRRVVWSVRVDEKLLRRAKPVLRAWFGSDCRGVESWLSGLVMANDSQQLTGVNPSHTSKVDIGQLVIARELRSRRKLVVDEEENVTVSVTCGYASCLGSAVGKGVWRDGRVFALCKKHFEGALKRGGEWTDLQETSRDSG